jgi:hypothetical protein
MTEEQIKATISQHFVQLIAGRRGFKCAKPEPDHGCDLTVTKVAAVKRNDRTRYVDSGCSIDLQLKSTCEAQVTRTEHLIKYDLESKTYNDLVFRLNSAAIVPLILVVLVLPDDPNQWVTITADELVVRRAAYWYVPPARAAETNNVHSIRIDIPTANVIDLTFVDARFQEVYG